MSKISTCTNFIIIDSKKLNFIKIKGTARGREIVSRDYFDLGEDVDISSFDKKELVLLISFSQLFVENFFVPVQARAKLDEVVKLKFSKQLSFTESDLYFSYYVDDNLQEDKLNVVCFAVKKDVLNKAYNSLTEKGIKIRAILPLPMLSYIYHSQQNRRDLKPIYNVNSGDFSPSERAILYLDRFSTYLNFTVFHSDGVYLRSGSLDNLNQELNRTIEYLGDYLKISELDIYNDREIIEIGDLIENTESTQIYLEDNFPVILDKIDINKADINSLDFLHKIPNEKKKKRNKYKVMTYLIIFLILVSNIFSFITYLQVKKDSLDLNKEKLAELDPAINQLEELQNQIDVKDRQREVYKDILANRESYLFMIYELSRQLPDSVKIEHLNLKGDSMVLLDGSAQSASKVMETLQGSEVFENLEFIGGIVIDDDRERFRIAGDLINE